MKNDIAKYNTYTRKKYLFLLEKLPIDKMIILGVVVAHRYENENINKQ